MQLLSNKLKQTVIVLAIFFIAMCFHHPTISQDLTIDAPASVNTDSSDPFNLSAVRDNSELSADENLAYYGLLNLADEQPLNELAADAQKFTAVRRGLSNLPTFVDMIRNPKEFRGKPVLLKGHILQTLEYDAEENEFGIEKLYESTLFTEDSQSHPTTIVFLEKPENLPIGGELIDRATVTGYFLKIYVYPSSDNHNRIAPLILAKTISVRPAPTARSGMNGPLIYWSIGIVFAVLIIVMVTVQRSDRKRTLAAQKKRLEENDPKFDDTPETP